VESNGGSWLPPVVVGGCGGVSRVVWQSFEKGRCENRVFYAEENIYNLQILLSKNPFLVLSVTFRAEHNSLFS